MPTPSQPPLDPTSPPPYVFPTCPDDQPHAAEQADELSQLEPDEMEVRPGSSTVVASPSPYSSDPTHDTQDGLSTDDVMRFDGHDHIETTSTFRTSSPTPSSDRTAPAGEQEGDDCLTHDADDRGVFISQKPSTGTNSAQLSTLDTTNAVCLSSVDVMDVDEYDFSSIENDYSRLRTIPISPSSYLRPGSKFRGTQRSERQRYEVQVEIKHVDMRESFLCGYLRIQGLTEDHPTLTTYFEGEIIGTKYNFYTQHEDWGANVKVDLNHWSKFRAFKPFIKMARKGPVSIPDNAQKEYIFMRWKEHFLVPDHRVRTITGASFEGFYYICFNQLKGEVNGIYFHSKSEKFQQLELMHVPDRGCFSALEFR